MRRAFTLTELLVCIGIIAVLIGLLIPAVSRSRRAAGTVACASNLRQLGVAFTMYEADWKVWPVSQWVYFDPPNDERGYRSKLWFDLISSYVGPATNTDGQNWEGFRTLPHGQSVIRGCAQAWDDPRLGPGYGMNSMFAMGSPLPALPYMVFPFAEISPWMKGVWSRQKDWTRPTEKALLMDSLTSRTSVWSDWPWWADPSAPMPPRPHISHFSPDFTRHGPQATSPNAPAINTLFADLHVELVSARQAYTAITFQPTGP
jgi:prepilin-type N-terminal cleavage/methylation domain-containing protein